MKFTGLTSKKLASSFAVVAVAMLVYVSVAQAKRVVEKNRINVLFDIDANGNLSNASFPATAKQIAFTKSQIEILRNKGPVTNLSGKRQVIRNSLGPLFPAIDSIIGNGNISITRSRIVVNRKSGADNATCRTLFIHNPKKPQIPRPVR